MCWTSSHHYLEPQTGGIKRRCTSRWWMYWQRLELTEQAIYQVSASSTLVAPNMLNSQLPFHIYCMDHEYLEYVVMTILYDGIITLKVFLPEELPYNITWIETRADNCSSSLKIQYQDWPLPILLSLCCLSLAAVNLTLNSLIRSSDKLRDLLQDSFQFTPDLIRGMLNMELTISPADLLADNSTLNLQDLICSAKYVILISINLTSWIGGPNFLLLVPLTGILTGEGFINLD